MKEYSDENRYTNNFKHGEAERLVNEIRQHLHEVERCSDDPGKANTHRRSADELMGQMLKKLAPRFEYYARRWMITKSRDDIDDAIGEMTLRVVKRVQDTSGSAGAAFFEKLFNKAVFACMVEAVNFARRENLDFDKDLDKERKARKTARKAAEEAGEILEPEDPDEFAADLFPLSIDELDSQASEALEKASADSESIRTTESLLTEDVFQEFCDGLPPDSRRLIRAWWNQVPVKEIARRTGVGERTVRNRLAVLHEKLALLILGPNKVTQAKRFRASRK